MGEVGDHRSADDLWLLVDAEDGGYDVYDATGEYNMLTLILLLGAADLEVILPGLDDHIADSSAQMLLQH